MPLNDQDMPRPLDDVPLGAQSADASLADVPLPGSSSGSLGKAVFAGLVAALVSAAIWAGITIATNTKIGLVAVGVGFLCGVAVRAAGKGDGVPFRVIGAACALFGIVLGNAFMIVNQASKEGIPLGIVEAIPYVFTFAGPIDYLFYAIGVWQGWKVAVANPA